MTPLKSGLKSLYVALGRLAKLVSYTFVFFIPYWLYDAGGLGETVVCFLYMFWWRVIDCLLDSGVNIVQGVLLFEFYNNKQTNKQTNKRSGLGLVRQKRRMKGLR